jgi:hypothetical protein
VDVRAGALGLDHALGDDGAHLGERDELAGQSGAETGCGTGWQRVPKLALKLAVAGAGGAETAATGERLQSFLRHFR